MTAPINVRRARWLALSKGDKFSIARGRANFARMLEDIMEHKDIPISQRLLQDACNRRELRMSSLRKAFRLDASLNKPCNKSGGLAMHHYGRHGTKKTDANFLLSCGFDPMARDGEGYTFAHHAFEFHNSIMAEWIMEQRPESWDAINNDGVTPMDLACGSVSGINNGDEEINTSFRSWALRTMPENSKQCFIKHAWEHAAVVLKNNHRYVIHHDFAWLSSLDAPAFEADSLLAAVAQCDQHVAQEARPYFLAALALTERNALRRAVITPAPRRGASPRV